MIDLKITLNEFSTVKYALEDRVIKMNKFISFHIDVSDDDEFIKYAKQEIELCNKILNLSK